MATVKEKLKKKFSMPKEDTPAVLDKTLEPACDIKKSLKGKIAAVVLAASALAPSKVGKDPKGAMSHTVSQTSTAKPMPAKVAPKAAPKVAAPQAQQAAPQAPAPKAPPAAPMKMKAPPAGALVRAHSGADLPEFNVGGKWQQPKKISEAMDFLAKNPAHADQYQAVRARMAAFKRGAAGTEKEGYVYHQ